MSGRSWTPPRCTPRGVHAIICSGWRIRKDCGAQRVDEVIEQAGLQRVARRKAGGFSLGMRQRLGLAAALIADPSVLMLDEPFNGLDPEGIVWMRGFLRALAEQGRAVLVSSHLMSELEGTATQLLVIGRGRMVADTTVADLIATASAGRVQLRTIARMEATRCCPAPAPPSRPPPPTRSPSPGSPPSGWSSCSAKPHAFSEVSAHRASLEEAYMELTRDQVEFRAAPAQERARVNHRHDHALPLQPPRRP